MLPSNNPKMPKNSADDRGLYLILVAFFLFVLVALCALVVGLGFLSTNKTRMQNIANVASIAALETFVQGATVNGTPVAYDTRRNNAVTRTNEIIQANSYLPGVALLLGDVGLPPSGGAGGNLIFGMWYPEQVAGNPCGPDADDYPCFIPNDVVTGTPNANAVRLELKTQTGNPLLAPLAAMFGSQGINVSTEALARLVQRCVVFLLDASISTVQETHTSTDMRYDTTTPFPCIPPEWGGNCGPDAQNTRYPTPGVLSLVPNPVSLFAYIGNNLTPAGQITPFGGPTPHPCQNVENVQTDDFFYYCNMPPNRAGYVPGVGTPHTLHFRSDYRVSSSPYGNVLVDNYYQAMDSYFGPQPLSRFFLAFNAGVRALQQVSSPGDKALMGVFQGDIIDTEPIATPGSWELGEDLNMMVQLTNIQNRGVINASGTPHASLPVVTPNFVTRGWFPYAAASSDIIGSTTNLAKALWDSIAILSECPDSARRVVILATDGIPSCDFNRQNPGGTPTPNALVDCPAPTNAPDYYSNYLKAEAAILGPIKDELVRRGISVTALLDGDAIGLNFVNATVGPGTPTPSTVYVNPDDAAKYGFTGFGTPSFFDYAPSVGTPGGYDDWGNPPPLPPTGIPANCDNSSLDPGFHCTQDHYAFRFASVPQLGVKFKRPNALWGQLAIDTGGVICPLLPQCNPAWYSAATPPALLPTVRQGMSTVQCAPINQTKAQQAINCVLAAVGIDPYQNVAQLPTPTP